MTKRIPRLAIALILAFALTGSNARAQSLANRIASSSDRSVQFSYKARPGVCGDGRTYISFGSTFYGSYSSNDAEQCQTGPVRVIIDLADRNVVALRTYVGVTPVAGDAAVTNLG
ncbi:MAG TPA: hypothetical protein VF887_06860, partial [Gemmatimonadaceae bacterium]